MNGGIPFISNDRPEASKIIKENNCGFIFNDKDPKLISQQLIDILKKDLKEIGNNGKKAIEKKFIWKNDFELFFKKLS